MIESENLRTASLYINNQLLSRGLLRDGQTIDFANPGHSDGELAATMGKIMGVVNDLILRRDRDAEHRETLATTLRTVRAESLHQASDIQRLQERQAEAQRKADLAEVGEKTARAQLRTAEAGISKLRDEAARTKTLVAQTRSACANEVRKRDRQIDALKKAVTEAGRARGERKNPAVTTITVTGEIGGVEGELPGIKGTPRRGTMGEEEETGYDLRTETNAFLAELARGLSEENETLLVLVRGTSQKLKEMSGWDKGEDGAPASGDSQGSVPPPSPEEISGELNAILEHLRTILTNPSFVPLEEVVVREDEINRLRDGWEKMETRWKEAVHLMDGWRRRMQLSGRPVNMEELKMGLRLSPVRVHNVEETAQGMELRLETVREQTEEPSAIMMHSPSPEGSLHLVPAPDFIEDDGSESESSIFEDDVDIDDLEAEQPNVEILGRSEMLHSIDSPPLPPVPQLSPLKDSYSAGNRQVLSSDKPRQRPGDFTTIAEERTRDFADEAPPPPPHIIQPRSPARKTVAPAPRQAAREETPPPLADLASSSSSLDSILLVKPSGSSTCGTSVSSSKSQEPQHEALPRHRGATVHERLSGAQQQKTATSGVSNPSRAPPARARTQIGDAGSQKHTAKAVRTISSASNASSASNISNLSAASSSRDPDTDSTMMPPPPLPRHGHAGAQPSDVGTPGGSGINKSPRRVNSRLPLPRTAANTGVLPQPQQSPLTMATIAAKLAASEREADAARVRAKLKAARLGKRISLAPAPPPPATAAAADEPAASTGGAPRGDEDNEDRGAVDAGDPVKKDKEQQLGRSGASEDRRDGDEAVGSGGSQASSLSDQQQQRHQKVRKRERRTSRVASRRRSTLNPWELQSLIQGDVAASAGADGL